MKESIIDKYISEVNKLLNEDVKFEYYISFGNIHASEWRTLKDEDIPRIKSDEGLNLVLLSKKTLQKNEFPLEISAFKLVQMPGCCGICISTGVSIHPSYRGRGLNTLLNNMRIELARLGGYTLLMCTDLVNNIPERKTLDKNYWRDIYLFKNLRTSNELAISIRDL